jgi:ankyrin repeat protein
MKLSNLRSISLYEAAYDQHEAILDTYSRLQALDIVFKGGVTSLHASAQSGNIKHVQRMCKEFDYPGRLFNTKHIWSIDAKDYNSRSPLKAALEHGHKEVARVLVENGAEVSQELENILVKDDWYQAHIRKRNDAQNSRTEK